MRFLSFFLSFFLVVVERNTQNFIFDSCTCVYLLSSAGWWSRTVTWVNGNRSWDFPRSMGYCSAWGVEHGSRQVIVSYFSIEPGQTRKRRQYIHYPKCLSFEFRLIEHSLITHLNTFKLYVEQFCSYLGTHILASNALF